jgi:hypothetical protein
MKLVRPNSGTAVSLSLSLSLSLPPPLNLNHGFLCISIDGFFYDNSPNVSFESYAYLLSVIVLLLIQQYLLLVHQSFMNNFVETIQPVMTPYCTSNILSMVMRISSENTVPVFLINGSFGVAGVSFVLQRV